VFLAKGLPAEICKEHLPNHDVDIILEDDEGQICYTKYKASRTALSGGWHGFARMHHLKVGNVLVFQVVSPTKLKVSASVVPSLKNHGRRTNHSFTISTSDVINS
jgi:hypothetical protein